MLRVRQAVMGVQGQLRASVAEFAPADCPVTRPGRVASSRVPEADPRVQEIVDDDVVQAVGSRLEVAGKYWVGL